MMDESETSREAVAIMNEGRDSRRHGKPTSCPYGGNTLKHMLFGAGWLTEDLRIALMRSNPEYEKGQAAFGQGLKSLKGQN